MPILRRQLIGQGRTAEGEDVQLPPQTALIHRGPVVQVSLGIEQNMAQELVSQGDALPEPINGLALIDTGATSTCVDIAAADELGVPVVDVARVMSVSEEEAEQNIYPVQIDFQGTPIIVNVARAVGAPLARNGLVALIGRDILQHCTLHYNGPSGSFTLAY